jgi:cytochrome c-type biogenesis protein CcmH/NrfG
MTKTLGPSILALCALTACQLDRAGSTDPQLAERIAQKRSALSKSPGDAQLLTELGELYSASGSLFEAADAFQGAIDHGAKSADVHAGLANAYLRLGYVARSVDELKACMTLDHNNPGCVFTLGNLFYTEGSPEGLRESRRSLRQFLSIAPNHPKAAEAQAMVEQIDSKLGPDTGAPTAPHGELHAASPPAAEGEEEEAPPEETPAGHGSSAAMIPGHDTIDKAGGEPVGELNPYGQALGKAFAAQDRNDAKGAEAGYREALQIRAGDSLAMSGLANALLIQGKNDEAQRAAEEAYAKAPQDSQVRWIYGLVALKTRKNTDKGVAAWEALAKDDPELAGKLHIPETLAALKGKLHK